MTAFISSLRERHLGAALGLRAAKGQHGPAEGAALAEHATGRRAQRAGVRWVRQYSTVVGPAWSVSLDFVFLEGDHSEEGCELDWHHFPARGARGPSRLARLRGVRRRPHRQHVGPVRVCDRHVRNPDTRDPKWRIVAEVDSWTGGRTGVSRS